MITAAALLLFTLLCAYLSGDGEWANVTKAERNDLVFDGRHRGYGAYILRREYDRRLMIALFVGFGALGFAVGGAKLLLHGSAVGVIPQVRIIDQVIEVFEIPPAPPEDLPTPPAPAGGGTPVPAIGTILMIDTAVVDKDTTSAGPALPPSDSLAAGGGGKGPGPVDPPPGGGGRGTDLGGGEPPLGTALQERPEFAGGDAAMYRWLTDHVRFPEEVQEEGKSDKVYVEFVIEQDGSISSAKAVRGRNGKAKKEGERVVLAMPKWSPGKMDGHAVRCRLVLPINFTVAQQ